MTTARYVTIDGLFSPSELIEANSVWPASDAAGWHTYDARHERKRASDLVTPLPPLLAGMLAHLASLNLGAMLGMPTASADLSLHGGGLHELPPGPGLGCHLDADTHPRLQLARAWSASLYVHSCWDRGWGGALVLHAERGDVFVRPLPGRLVAFDASLKHHVEPISCPEGEFRRSLALFGYLPKPGKRERLRALFDGAEESDRVSA